ncbi:uncharacterized protein N7446_003556 [Penicillium canescens]|uniref:Uncharacterized protein n=1 Tax=Penicillium canescens TaxID=5083 RepID=A0AAD6I2S8_PENCN|nr:uncharacterized protein N7446_003556 [Penicillium canescens]KAJ6027845.1 hypothetical protein N7460_012662 [Penicillium canescens]KAJ6041127.1 hypothetical protein N7444_010032 [Penicillium canescens]KAJ6066519.1 hypothetical protein N7446_003556 [Penicillium canescens]
MTTSSIPSSVGDAQKATTFVFGGHIGTQSKRSLKKPVKQLLSGPNAKWILEAVAGLPQYWAAVVEKIPEAGTVAGAEQLSDFDSWLRNGISAGDLIAPEAELPSVAIGPLMVAIQLDQYWRYLEFRLGDVAVEDPQAELVRQQQQQNTTPVETLGFCAGLIAAVAVASSHDVDEFQKYGAVAVRLGLLMAAVVDAREARDTAKGKGGSVSFATAWRSGSKQGDDMTRIVSSLTPDAYISVLFDEARATVTTSERLAPTLVRKLRAAGVKAVPLGFKGYLHAPGAERKRDADALIELCHSTSYGGQLQFPATAAQLALPTYSNSADGAHVSADETDLTAMLLRAILTQQFNWAGTVSKLLSVSASTQKEVSLVAFGLDQCIPPTITRRYGPKETSFEELEPHIESRRIQRASMTAATATPTVNGTSTGVSTTISAASPMSEREKDTEEAIAIVGMSINVSGAEDLEEFAAMLKTGKSQHEVITRERMMHDMLFRDAADADGKKYYGNFVRDADAFDHKFFKRSPRESQAMDPQCRLSLQAAYQAVEQSGYFTEPKTDKEEHIGCYLGVCGVDYEQNIASHAPSAFTATGGLRSFITGRIAHFFGWTGPAMTFDTACSSSTVAMHTACRNILSGEASAALVGGVNVMTNLQWIQNLSAGSFLSPTGQCKPFDGDADGYCRAEGVAFVFLKKLSDAQAAGNTVLGTIRATAVYQNLNITPLFVPNVPSLSQLFKDVIKKAGIDPAEISVVEAHGTGTPVGDPAEYESVKLAVASPLRETAVAIGSVKGHVGHTEGASGVIALVKLLMMMRDNFIPPQASFKRMNPHIHASPTDMVEVVTALRPWPADRKVALLNNYGACGSNASLVLAYSAHKPTPNNRLLAEATARQPFWITGFDARSIAVYSKALALYLRTHTGGQKATLADVAFNLARQSNPGLPQGLVFSCRSLEELQEKLTLAAVATKETAAASGIAVVKAERPVVLCFGGQNSTFVGLERALYDGVAVLQQHLDACDAAVTAAGLSSIFPAIFSRKPIRDIVQLQTALFAMQYASARAWIDCGLASKVVSVVGHSFGEITALCVAGVLSLSDTVRLVAGRARLVRDAWGPDSGAMMAVEADEALVHDLLKAANITSDGSASIACYNGPRSFTLAGTTQAIDAVAATLAGNSKFAGAGIKSKRLNVTNAFHSVLVEQLVGELGNVGRGLTFHSAEIPVERATEHDSTEPLDWSFVPSHMRQPVFFNHAVQRLAKKHPQAIFLEAGSNSTITVMASRALAQVTSASPDMLAFQAVSITNTEKGLDGLTDATVALWKQGLRVSFWPHHPSQAREYVQLLLPPYQFEKSRHWLDVKSPTEVVSKAAQAMIEAGGYTVGGASVTQVEDPRSLPLWTFIGYPEAKKNKKLARFRINTASDPYQRLFSSHVIAQTAPICPATLEIDMAIEALFSLNLDWRPAGYSPTVHNLISHAPVCADSTRVFYMDLSPLDKAEMKWHLSLHSVASNGDSQVHAEATIRMRAPTDTSFLQQFSHYERLVNHAQCQSLLKLDLDNDGVEMLHGRNVYRAFSEIVDFGPVYRGVKYIVGRPGESAGVIHKRHEGHTWLDVPMGDSFGQVAGIYVNLLTDDLPPGEMFIATSCELLMRSPKALPEISGKENGPGIWHVLARHTRQSDKAYISDVFVFDAATGALNDVMLGLQYARVPKASMSKILTRFTTDQKFLRNPAVAPSVPAAAAPAAAPPVAVAAALEAVKTSAKVKKEKKKTPDITQDVCNLVANVSGVDPSDMTLDSEMADLGIDSLMGMELAREVENTFKFTLDHGEMMEATSLRQFVACVANGLSKMGVDAGGDAVDQNSDDSDSDSAAELITPPDENDDTASDITTPDPEEASALAKPVSLPVGPVTSNLTLSHSDILECFGQVKLTTDDKIREFGLDSIARVSLAGSSKLCTALVVEAFDQLGSPLRTAASGQLLDRVAFLPQHGRMMEFVYGFLEREARLIDIDTVTGQITRTHIAVPRKNSATLLEEMVAAHPESAIPDRLAYYAGKNLAGVLSGTTDGIRVIFGSAEGRQLVQAMYCDYGFNRMHYQQMADVITQLSRRVTQPGETLKVLEMGGGTGGTTNVMAPVLASLGIPVEYTFTDLSPSMVANARRKFAKQYPFMRFAVHDIEKTPAAELLGQHLVLASNAIHATHDLVVSTQNVHLALRPDGFLMILEMTECVPSMDIVFGLLEGWWLFDDGRTHAVVPTEDWERALHAAGFGHVDWTDGNRPENAFQKVIIALASGERKARLPASVASVEETRVIDRGDVAAREADAEQLVDSYTSGWATPALDSAAIDVSTTSTPAVVIVTGATGSLGAHLVQTLAKRPDVATVVCMNRHSSVPVHQRQAEAFLSRGIALSPTEQEKLRVYETDTSKPQLGLPTQEYVWLVSHATHIVHNAWPMSGTRPLKGFEPQLQTMRNLLDLAREIALGKPKTRVGFQFVSSIGVVGYADTSAGPRIKEDRVPMAAVMPGGYPEGKWVHERMLDETLHCYPHLFRATVTRPGQIAGSSRSGFWNPVEHFAFLVKSAQVLRVWPDLHGTLQWLPVDRSASVMVDLLKLENDSDAAYPVYHIDNPVGQPWEDMSPVLASALDIPPQNIIPYADWIMRVRRSPLSADENPAARLIDFLDGHFERMSCGGIILDTQKAKEHSATMAAEGPVNADIARAYVASWKAMGYLK